MNFRFKGVTTAAVGEVIKEIDCGGQTVTISKGSYKAKDGSTNHTIVVSGVGKETRMGPQKALAILAAGEEIEAYFREVGVIE